jgi:hypothetical protein
VDEEGEDEDLREQEYEDALAHGGCGDSSPRSSG